MSNGDRVGLVGPNGSGKTTQLKILSGEIEPSYGDVVKSSKDMRIAYLKQEFTDELNMENTLKDELQTTFAGEMAILDSISRIEGELEATIDDQDLMTQKLNELSDLQSEANSKGLYAIDGKIEKVMEQCGFGEADGKSLISSFSGGGKCVWALQRYFFRTRMCCFLTSPQTISIWIACTGLRAFLSSKISL